MLKWGATADDLRNAVSLIENSPITQGEKIDSYPILGETGLNVLSHYENFFAELVTETFFSGNTFFMTEKICRPMVTKTPFIVFASTGYLKELKTLGYKTFDRWWSEEYDIYGEQARIKKIQEVIQTIMSWDSETTNRVYQEMIPTLEHNRKIFLENAK
jgi:hypothetical protein